MNIFIQYTRRKTSFLLVMLSLGLLGFNSTDDIQAQAIIGSALPMQNTSFTKVDGSTTTLGDVKGSQGTVVVFWCASCPWVKKYEERMAAIISDYSQQGFGFVLVNSNDPVAYPEDNMEAMKDQAKDGTYSVPYVADSGSQLARALDAKRTPHSYVYDANDILQYVGAIDDSPSNAAKVQDTFLRDALDAVKAGTDVAVKESKSFGCKIKMQS